MTKTGAVNPKSVWLPAVKSKSFFICLTTILVAAFIVLTISSRYVDKVQKMSEKFSEIYQAPLKIMPSKIMSFGQDEELKTLDETEVTDELKNLDNLIAQYNERADTSGGALKRYVGERDPESFTEWIMGKLIDMSIIQSQSSGSELDQDKPEKSQLRSGTFDENEKPGKDENFAQILQKTSTVQKSSVKQKLSTGDKFSTEQKSSIEQKTSIEQSVLTNQKPLTEEAPSHDVGDLANSTRRLVLFSTWVDVLEKRQAQENVLRTWRLWTPYITPLVFSGDDRIRNQAGQYGWEALNEPAKTCGGVPILREMFRSAMKHYDSQLYGFVNGDLLLGNGLLSTVEALVNNKDFMEKPLLAIVKRINVDFKNRAPVENVDNLRQIANEGKPMVDGSSDGFLTNRLFPWDHVPDIVPGRIGIAMWLVSYAREMGVQVVDISDTVIAVHMMATAAGNHEAWVHKNPRCNHNIYDRLKIKPLSWFCGFLACAQYKTTRTDGSSQSRISIVDKSSTNHPRCANSCEMDVKKLKQTKY